MTSALVAQDISLTYAGPPEVIGFTRTSLRFEHGHFISIQGPSGAGKSSLMNVLGLLQPQSTGTLEIGGELVDSENEAIRSAVRSRKIGFVVQQAYLVSHLNVAQNVELGLRYSRVPRGEREERSAECLELVGVSHRALARPETLSGGERQRVAIARALATKPDVLLCDEPTGNLDSERSGSIVGLLTGVASRNSCVVMVTHDVDVAKRAESGLVVKDGRVSQEYGVVDLLV